MKKLIIELRELHYNTRTLINDRIAAYFELSHAKRKARLQHQMDVEELQHQHRMMTNQYIENMEDVNKEMIVAIGSAICSEMVIWREWLTQVVRPKLRKLIVGK